MKSNSFSLICLLAGCAAALAGSAGAVFAQGGGEDSEEPLRPEDLIVDTGADAISEQKYAGVVRIENAAVVSDYRTPWNPGRPSGGSGTGFLIGPNRFMTNAHVVSDSSRVLIKKVGDPRPMVAKIEHIAHDADLALLSLEDPTPFKDVTPFEVDGIPKLDTSVTAVGYPIGGQRISVTRGIVSRVDFRPYAHSGVDYHLTIQIDAAINPGNSGGPVLQDGQVVGVAFQGYSGSVAQNTGYMIPAPVIKRFLQDVEDGKYDHYVDLSMSEFPLLNAAQREALGLPREYEGQGIMVGNVDEDGSTGGILEIGDVVLEIDGNRIASNGFIDMAGERVNMNEIVERKFAGETITLKVWRDGEVKDVEVTLKRPSAYLMTANQYGKQPEYVVYGGLVFQPLDRNLMAAHGISNETARYYFSQFVSEALHLERPEPVIFTAVLPDAINTHLEGYIHNVVDQIGDTKITRMEDVVEALRKEEAGDDPFVVIKLLNEGRPLVLEKSKLTAANARIAEKYGVRDMAYVE